MSFSPTGSAAYTYTFQLPKGFGGMTPEIGLSYNSQGGLGLAGWGVSLTVFHVITRVPRDIYHDGKSSGAYTTNCALSLDGRRLILHSGGDWEDGAVYYAEGDPFSSVTLHKEGGVATFTITTSDGVTMRLGAAEACRQTYYKQDGTSGVNSWFISEEEDACGNMVEYSYARHGNTLYPSVVEYRKNVAVASVPIKVSLSYVDNPNGRGYYIDGCKCRLDKMLSSIAVKSDRTLRQYTLEYDTECTQNAQKRSRLVRINEFDGNSNMLNHNSLEWQKSGAVSISSTELPYSSITTDHQLYLTDFNGDGKDELVSMENEKYGSSLTKTIYVRTVSKSGSGYSMPLYASYPWKADIDYGDGGIKSYSYLSSPLDFNGDGKADILVPNISGDNKNMLSLVVFGDVGNSNIQAISTANVKLLGGGVVDIAAADLDHDGKSEIVFLEKQKFNDTYVLHAYNEGSGNITNVLKLSSEPTGMYLADFNGDGMVDLLVPYKGGYSVFWNQCPNKGEAFFSFRSSTSYTSPTLTGGQLAQGDFNGDGLPDFLFCGDKSNDLCFLLNTGKGAFTSVKAYTNKQDRGKQFKFIPIDINRDGITDIVAASTKTVKDGCHTALWLISNGSSLRLVKEGMYKTKTTVHTGLFAVGDILGDGSPGIVNYGGNLSSASSSETNSHLYWNRDTAFDVAQEKVIAATDGFGNQRKIHYSTLVDNNVYTPDISCTYPVVSLTVPLLVVSSMESNIGLVDQTTMSYCYKGLRVHQQGKGMLGFEKTTTTDSATGTKTETSINSWDATTFVPNNVSAKTTLADNSTSATTTTYNVNTTPDGNYAVFPKSKTTTDFDGNKTTTTYTYDTSIGKPTEIRTEYGSTDMYRGTSYSGYELAGGQWLPKSVTSRQKHHDEASEFSSTINYTYNQLGQVETETASPGTGHDVVTAYTYETVGSVKSKTVSAEGLEAVSTYYDHNGSSWENPVKVYSSTPYTQVVERTYDDWGNTLTETDATDPSSPLATTYTFDVFGNQTGTLNPDGSSTRTTRGWGTIPTKKYYVLEEGTGEPWTVTWYDCLGRKTSVESVGFGDIDQK